MCTSSRVQPSQPTSFYSETCPTLTERTLQQHPPAARLTTTTTTTKSVSTTDASSSTGYKAYPAGLSSLVVDSGTSSPTARFSPTSLRPATGSLRPTGPQQQEDPATEDTMETVEALLSLSHSSRSPGGSPDKPALITILPAHNPDKG